MYRILVVVIAVPLRISPIVGCSPFVVRKLVKKVVELRKLIPKNFGTNIDYFAGLTDCLAELPHFRVR